MILRARTLVLACGGMFVISTAFPVVASVLQNPASRWVGIADVVVAAVLLCHGFLIAAKGSAKADPHVLELSLRVLRGGANLFLALIVVFFLAAQHVKWDILLLGLAWRAWLFVWVLPSAIALWRVDGKGNSGQAETPVARESKQGGYDASTSPRACSGGHCCDGSRVGARSHG
jgi:hypothetical protein